LARLRHNDVRPKPVRLFYRSVPPEELAAYRRAVRRAKGRLVALEAGDVVATFATVPVNCHNENPQYAYAPDVAVYLWGQLLRRWGGGADLAGGTPKASGHLGEIGHLV
jgi:hypothetical protein